MASFNRVVLVGNLTRDPELRYIPSGTAVSEIGLAVNDRRKDASGKWIEEVTFVDVTLWGRQAEIASEYASKGSPVLIEGRLKLDSWESDGQKRSKLRVIGERVILLGARGGVSGGSGNYSGGGSQGYDAGYSRGNSSPAQGRNDNAGYDSYGGEAPSPDRGNNAGNSGRSFPGNDYGGGVADGGDDDIPF